MLTPQQFAQAYGLTAAPAPPAPAVNPAFSYVTQAGDRWDTIAWNFYGDPTEIAPMGFFEAYPERRRIDQPRPVRFSHLSPEFPSATTPSNHFQPA